MEFWSFCKHFVFQRIFPNNHFRHSKIDITNLWLQIFISFSLIWWFDIGNIDIARRMFTFNYLLLWKFRSNWSSLGNRNVIKFLSVVVVHFHNFIPILLIIKSDARWILTEFSLFFNCKIFDIKFFRLFAFYIDLVDCRLGISNLESNFIFFLLQLFFLYLFRFDSFFYNN